MAIALTTFGDIQTAVLNRLGVSTVSSAGVGYTDDLIKRFILDAHDFVTGYHKWPQTYRHDAAQAFSSGTEIYNYPSDFKTDSVRFLQVGGKRHIKTAINQYLQYREDSSTGQDRVWGGWGRIIYVNPNTDASGTIEMWGQFLPVIDATDLTATTIFSSHEQDGNLAIVEEALSYASEKERQPVGFARGRIVSVGMVHHQSAMEILDRIWQGVKDEQFGYMAKDQEMFKRMDMLRGANRDDIFKRDQFY